MMGTVISFFSKKNTLFTFSIIICGVILIISSAWNESQTIDEVVYIGAGYSYLTTQNMHLSPEHPPLFKDLAAIPLLFFHFSTPNIFQQRLNEDFNNDDQWVLGYGFLYKIGNNAMDIIHAARIPMALFFILSALLIAGWADELYGPIASKIALLLFTFSPTVLAHSRYVANDIAVLFGVLAASYYFIRYLKLPSRRSLIISGLILGVALLTKFSAFLLVPFFLILSLTYGMISGGIFGRTRPSSILHFMYGTAKIIAIAFMFVILPVYIFHTFGYAPEQQQRDAQTILGLIFPGRFFVGPMVWLSGQELFRAFAWYGVGLFMTVSRQSYYNQSDIYLLGRLVHSGVWWYFPLVYVIKEPIPWLVMLFTAVLFTLKSARKLIGQSLKNLPVFIHEHFEALSMLLFLGTYWAVSMRSVVNIGIRLLLPTYPFAILLVSGQIVNAGKYIQHRSKKVFQPFAAIIVFLLVWYIFEAVHIYPYYLTYFNQFIGGPAHGWEYVVDSNLDWGQDLQRLDDWLTKNGIKKIEFGALGPTSPDYYLGEKYVYLNTNKYKDRDDFISRNKTGGWIALSSTQYLQLMPDAYPLWLKSIPPVTIVGNSIFVWHVTE